MTDYRTIPNLSFNFSRTVTVNLPTNFSPWQHPDIGMLLIDTGILLCRTASKVSSGEKEFHSQAI
jgi:hypothetical protein